MTVKIDINKYSSGSPYIAKMLHMADQAKLGEAENGNGMLDTEKEVDRFLKLAEKNKDKLTKQGFKVEGNSGIFTITKTSSEYNAEKYNSILTYDRIHDYIQEETNAAGLTAKIVFNNNDNIDTTLLDGKSGEILSKPDKNGKLNSLSLAILNLLTFGGISRRISAINQLSNVLTEN